MKNTLYLRTRDAARDIDGIKKAAEILKNGGLVAIPTETVYGLAADAFNEEAVRSIFLAKGRPQDNPLIVHISRFEELYSLALDVPESAKRLARLFWPGPLTIILKKKPSVPSVTSGGLDTVAVRMPANEIAAKIIALSCPLAAPSANASGFPSPTLAEHVAADMDGRIDAVCDGGECAVGVESTVISLAGEKPVLLRPGAVTAEQLRDALGEIEISDAVLNPLPSGADAASPGMKYKHYSPKAKISVAVGSPSEAAEYLSRHREYDSALCFEGEEELFKGVKVVTYGKRDEPLTQTKRLFAALRELDEKGAKNALAMRPSKEGLGLAVCNRLFRAAAFRFVNATNRPVIGLTGPTGAGKGYVGQYLRSLGCFVSDTDAVARLLTQRGSAMLYALADEFGEEILTDGELNRKKLAHLAFSSDERRLRLNAIMHPEIVRRSYEDCLNALENGAKAAIIDAPLLFEAHADSLCDCIIAVTAPLKVRLERIMRRDNIDYHAALNRISSQHGDEFYNGRADAVVRSYPPYLVEEELREFLKKIGLVNK